MRRSADRRRGAPVVARCLAPVALLLALATACAPGTYTPPTPQQRLDSDMRYCRDLYTTYQGAKRNYGSAASATMASLYEHRCVYITLPPVRSYQELLFMYEQGIL